MNVPENLKYTKTHEWVRDIGEGVWAVGITDYAQSEMTELVFVELPEVGRTVAASEEVAVVESVKSASDIYSPLSGEITENNAVLKHDASVVNTDPFETGWLFKLRISKPAELDALLSPKAYRAQIS